MAFPLVAGKVDDWKAFASQLKGERSAAFADMNRRYGLEKHNAWLEQAPGGGWIVLVEIAGPGSGDFFAKLSRSDEPFDLWFREEIGAAHGVDFSRPPQMPAPELYIEGGMSA
jgi:hypothetical protein